MECGSFDGGDDGEHNGVGFVEIFKYLRLRMPFLLTKVILWTILFTVPDS